MMHVYSVLKGWKTLKTIIHNYQFLCSICCILASRFSSRNSPRWKLLASILSSHSPFLPSNFFVPFLFFWYYFLNPSFFSFIFEVTILEINTSAIFSQVPSRKQSDRSFPIMDKKRAGWKRNKKKKKNVEEIRSGDFAILSSWFCTSCLSYSLAFMLLFC